MIKCRILNANITFSAEREDSEDTEGEQDDISEEIVSESPDNLSEASNEQLVSELERTLSFRAGEIEKVQFLHTAFSPQTIALNNNVNN